MRRVYQAIILFINDERGNLEEAIQFVVTWADSAVAIVP